MQPTQASSPPAIYSKSLQKLGIRHGFSTRHGGVSEGAFRSMNLARAVGDDPGAVEENYRRFAMTIGYNAAELVEVSQVHGAEVLESRAVDDAAAFRRREADALVSRDARQPIGIRVADCLPVLVADTQRTFVGAIHAGWRGAAASIATRVVEFASRDYGVMPQSLVFAFGPHIRQCCFEVGPEVVGQLVQSVPEPVRVNFDTNAKKVSLADIVRMQLEAAGVLPDHIEDVEQCTFCDPNLYYSHRRDKGVTGRHLAVIVAPDNAT